MEAYSKEFRRDVLRACDAGGGTREVALKFNVSESWVRRIKQERREQGKVAPKTTRSRRKVWEPHAGPPAGHVSPRAPGGGAGGALLAGVRRHAESSLPRAAPHAKKRR